MTKQKGIDLGKLVIQAERDLQEKNNKGCALFALERGTYQPNYTELGYHQYKLSPNIRKNFDKLLQDVDFKNLNYTDVVGGPLREKNGHNGAGTMTRKNDLFYWATEVANVIRRKEPENLVFYLRREPKLIAARILISVPDFYGGLTEEEAIAKYGGATFNNMRESLNGITLSEGYDGKIRIPYSDLTSAFRMAKGQKKTLEMWD